MDTDLPEKPVEELPQVTSEADAGVAVPAAESAGPPGVPQVTFRGNTYDLAALGALAMGVLTLFTCVTCGAGAYCLPLIPVVLGAIGLLGARQSVEEGRTRLWSWLGIAAGGVILLIVLLMIVLYIGIIVVAAIAGQGN